MSQETVQSIELQSDIMFEFDKEKKIGHMRADFDNRRSSKAMNKWFPSENINEKVQEYGIDLHEVQEAVNWVIFDKVNTYDKVVDYCGGEEGYEKDNSYYFQHGKCDYWVRLIPVSSDYNIYVSVYHK